MHGRTARWPLSLPVALSLLLGAFGYGGCNGGGTTPEPSGVPAVPGPSKEPLPDGQAIELRLDQPTEIDGLTLTWVSIEDSRCPQGVTCVWAGEAVARVRVKGTGEDSEITLGLGPRPNGDVATTARHEFRLTAVEPYPKHGTEVTRAERRATVVVKRR